MESVYQFSPLRTRNAIRLIELSPGSPNDSTIHISFKLTNLHGSKGEFEALSYVWGSEVLSRYVLCGINCLKLYITENCFTALSHLRYQHKTRMLWVDSICINQSDMLERNAQVSIMGKIFKAAEQTIVFLGESNYESSSLFQYINLADSVEGSNDVLLSTPPQSIVNQLGQLFNRPWFTRIWVVQEILNSAKVLFMCGPDAVTESSLKRCLYGYDTNFRVLGEVPPPIHLKFSGSHKSISECTDPKQQMYLLVASTSGCEATDARDRIFSLIPLLTLQDPDFLKLINYNRSVEDIFEAFSILLLSEVKLLLLYLIRHPHSRSLPSWIPDWNQKSSPVCWLSSIHEFTSEVNTYGACQDFTVGQVSPSVDNRNPSHQLLTVKGLRYGCINKTSPAIHISSTSVEERLHASTGLFTIVDALRNGEFSPQWPGPIVQALRQVTRSDVFSLLTAGHAGTYSGDFVFNEELSYQIVETCDRGVIFVTHEGKLGVAPMEAKEGDVICLIKGAMMPCILREKTIGSWSIISGHCCMLDISEDFYRRCSVEDISPLKHLIDIIPEPSEEFRII